MAALYRETPSGEGPASARALTEARPSPAAPASDTAGQSRPCGLRLQRTARSRSDGTPPPASLRSAPTARAEGEQPAGVGGVRRAWDCRRRVPRETHPLLLSCGLPPLHYAGRLDRNARFWAVIRSRNAAGAAGAALGGGPGGRGKRRGGPASPVREGASGKTPNRWPRLRALPRVASLPSLRTATHRPALLYPKVAHGAMSGGAGGRRTPVASCKWALHRGGAAACGRRLPSFVSFGSEGLG